MNYSILANTRGASSKWLIYSASANKMVAKSNYRWISLITCAFLNLDAFIWGN